MITSRARRRVLPDVLRPDLDLVFCGTAASRASAAAGAYYANPGNFFWRTVHAVGLIPRPLAPREFRRLPGFGIGLTDLAKHHVGNDDELPTGAFDVAALRRKILRHAPRLLAFTSKNAAQAALGHAVAYGPQAFRWDTTVLWVLPSPSGQARRFWDERPWRELAATVRAPR
jgi:TDG/mug DNA glycosylase family protein